MRRGSLLGPMLLILIGVWFLISSLRPDLPLLEVAANYWPFLLIAWGVLRFLEILVWSMRGRPLPRAGISGGEWTLIVFLCFMGSILYVVHRHRPWNNWGVLSPGSRVEIFGHPYDFPVPEQTVTATKLNRVLIENLRGSVRVVGADAKEIKLSGRKTIRALQDEDANNAQKATPVEVTWQGDQAVVRTNQDRITGEQRITTDLELTVPRSASVEIRGRNGDLEISDLNGGVEVSSDNASVRLQNIASNVRLDLRKSDLVRAGSVKGNFELDGGRGRDVELDTIGGEVTVNGSYSGDLQFRNCAKPLKFQSQQTELRVEKLPGQIHLDLGGLSGTNLVGPTRLVSNRARDVQIEQFTQAMEVQVDRGDVTLRPMEPPQAKIDVRTRSGQIDLALPDTSKFELRASTNRGELNNEYGTDLRTEYQSERRHEAGGTISGKVGQGPPITLNTDRGTITVRKDNGLPPKPPRPPKGPLPPPPPSASIEIERH